MAFVGSVGPISIPGGHWAGYQGVNVLSVGVLSSGRKERSFSLLKKPMADVRNYK